MECHSTDSQPWDASDDMARLITEAKIVCIEFAHLRVRAQHSGVVRTAQM